MKTVERVIHFYEIGFANEEKPLYKDILKEVFQKIIAINNDSSKSRFNRANDYIIYTQDVIFISEKKIIQGKVLRISMDSFPQIIDISEDIIRDIEVNDSDGLVETSHFMVDYNLSHSIILAMEHNHQGGKSNDLLKYINFVSSKYGIDKIMIEPYIKDSLETFVERIQRCAYFQARVKKEHIPAIQNLNGKLYTALDTAQELGKSDIVEILLTSDYRKKGETTAMTNLVRDLARRLFNQRSFAKNFEVLEAKAEDSDNFHRLEIFDLLSDKLKSLVRVQRRDRVKVIISSDMFLNLEIEINRHFK